MSMPQVPDLDFDISIDREDSINLVMASIAVQSLALAHILNAEGEKLQYVLGTLEGSDPGEVTICDIMAINESVDRTLRDVIKTEILLQFKMENALSGNGGDE